jgi:molybdenum cofactor cytidylyltransferase
VRGCADETQHMSAHAVIVLAAGASTRLGRAKQLLTVHAETLVHRMVRMALETHPVRVLVVTGAAHAAITEAVQDLDCVTVFNPTHETGMASSITCGLAALPPKLSAVLIMGCDQPTLTVAHLHALLAGAQISAMGCAALRSENSETIELQLGLPAVLSTRVLANAPALQGDQGFRALLRQNANNVFTLSDAALQHDIDTPDDLRFAIAQGWIDA